MSRDELNALRPGDKIVHEVAKTRMLGVIKAVWRDSHIRLRWQGDRTDDEIRITPQGDPHLKKASNA